MTHGQFLNAVALGQLTPGPVTQTVASSATPQEGFRARCSPRSWAFAPSFSPSCSAQRACSGCWSTRGCLAFLGGATPAAGRAIIGSAAPLAAALAETRQRCCCTCCGGGRPPGARPWRRPDAPARGCSRPRRRFWRADPPLIDAEDGSALVGSPAKVHNAFTRSFPLGHKNSHFAENSVVVMTSRGITRDEAMAGAVSRVESALPLDRVTAFTPWRPASARSARVCHAAAGGL